MQSDVLQIILTVAQTFLALATFLLALVVLGESRRERRTETSRIVQDSWNVVNTLAISDMDLLKIADELLDRGTRSQPIEQRRMRWVAFTILNALQASYLGMKYKTLDAGYAQNSLNHLLPNLIRDDEIYRLTQQRGYHPEFAHYCRKVKKKLGAISNTSGRTNITDNELLSKLLRTQVGMSNQSSEL